MEKIKAVDVKIFPYRRLKPETAEKILNRIMEFDGILRILVNGKSIPKIIGYGPAKGTPVNHEDRKVIKVKKENLELFVTIGELIITLRYEKLDLFLKKLEKLLKNNLSCEYDVSAGIFTKTNITVSDYLKLGLGFEEGIDPSLIGMVDPNSKSCDTIKLIGD
ncbi:MAG: methyl-coenzyme M reductase operon protein D [Methanobacteriaceae archaeon]|jgi:methyl-coenzyme M reductase subunit D|nr:methyl-coenzyme M reductase operon protein D [Methanobacteriaceae archaeon]